MHAVWDNIWGWTMSGKPLTFMAAAMLSADRDYCVVAKSYLYAGGVDIEVSTVFVVASISHDPVMPDDMFETMVFVGDKALPDPGPVNGMFGIDFGYKPKYPTWDDALAGHVRHVNLLRGQGFRPALGSA